jgi:hypothetical protein
MRQRPPVQGSRHVGVRHITVDVVLFHLFQIIDREGAAVDRGQPLGGAPQRCSVWSIIGTSEPLSVAFCVTPCATVR